MFLSSNSLYPRKSLCFEPSLALVSPLSGSRHAELEILEDNQAYLSLYDLDGPIVVETPLVRRAADAAPTVSRIHEYLAH
jgi:hypothetical protein